MRNIGLRGAGVYLCVDKGQLASIKVRMEHETLRPNRDRKKPHGPSRLCRIKQFLPKMALILLNNFCWKLLNATEPRQRDRTGEHDFQWIVQPLEDLAQGAIDQTFSEIKHGWIVG